MVRPQLQPSVTTFEEPGNVAYRRKHEFTAFAKVERLIDAVLTSLIDQNCPMKKPKTIRRNHTPTLPLPLPPRSISHWFNIINKNIYLLQHNRRTAVPNYLKGLPHWLQDPQLHYNKIWS